MDNESVRVQNWLNNFYEFLKNENSDLIPLFSGRIHFHPQQDKENSIHPALMELDERYASKEQIMRMWKVFEDYSSKNLV